MIATTVPTKKVSGPGHTLEKRERPHQLVLIHRNTLNRERTSQTEVVSIDDIIDRVSVSTQEISSLRSKPKVHVGKTIRKRKQTSQQEAPILKAAKVVELSECACALGFQCKCPQQCAGKFTTVAIQEFRKKYWELSAKVCNASPLNTTTFSTTTLLGYFSAPELSSSWAQELLTKSFG